MPITNQSIRTLVHDYETTGVNAATCGVLQSALAIVVIHPDGRYEVEDADCALLNPGVPIEPGATLIHGYSDFDVADKPGWEPYLREQFEEVNKMGLDAVVGYNSASFDNRIAQRAGFKPLPSIDLIKPARLLKKLLEWENGKLTTVYEQLVGRPLEKAHDAHADLIATLDLIAPMIISSPAEVTNLYELVAWSQGDDGTPNMRINFGKNKGSKLKNLDRSYVEWLLSDKCEMDLNHELVEGLKACLI